MRKRDHPTKAKNTKHQIGLVCLLQLLWVLFLLLFSGAGIGILAGSAAAAAATAMDSCHRKSCISLKYDVNMSLVEAGITNMSIMVQRKQLKRLPHVFCRVLELPIRSDAPVTIEENHDCFRFVANADFRSAAHVRADLVTIAAGVVKVVVAVTQNGGSRLESGEIDDLDLWRVRLPSCTIPELSVADYENGVLVVTIPKHIDESSTSSMEAEDKFLTSLGSSMVAVS